MARLFEKISGEGDAAEKGKVVKKIITGLKGSGKTVHLLQAMAMGFLKKWVVVTVPDGKSCDHHCWDQLSNSIFTNCTFYSSRTRVR
jgi:hypothetical protein